MKDDSVEHKVTSNLKADRATWARSVIEVNVKDEVNVKEGDRVRKGKPVVVISAMKIEMVVQAPCDGVVEKVVAKEDMKVDGDDLLFTVAY